MGLFRPYERSEDSDSETSTVSTPDGATKKKKVPTPTRREAEAARRERLHPTLSPAEQRQRDREAKTRTREDAWKKLDDEPGRTLLRNFIDSRKGITQWWMPVILGALAIALAAMYLYPAVAIYATFFPYLALLALGIHIFLLWGQYKRLHAERLPNEPLRGLLMYMVNRIISLRRLRMPAPTVKPGDEI
mgnify:CR=1 FL=1